jgi:hypothetical protein
MHPRESIRSWFAARIAAGLNSPTLSDLNCLLPDVPAVGVCNGYATVSLVTPNIIQFSAHYPIGPGATIVLNGETYLTVKSSFDPPSPTQIDLGFARLDRPVVGVKPLATFLNPTPFQSLTIRTPAVWYVRKSNRLELREITNWFAVTTSPAKKSVNASPPLGQKIGTGLVSGDSGSPLLTWFDGEPVILCTAFSGSNGSAIHSYYDLIYQRWANDLGLPNDRYCTITLKPGDTNDDGKVDFTDYITLANNYGKRTDQGHKAGDFDGDGDVDFADYTQLTNNFGRA